MVLFATQRVMLRFRSVAGMSAPSSSVARTPVLGNWIECCWMENSPKSQVSTAILKTVLFLLSHLLDSFSELGLEGRNDSHSLLSWAHFS